MAARRRRGIWAVVILAALGAIWIKVRVEAGLSLDQARHLEEREAMPLAISTYRQTLRWYSPYSGPVADAASRLVTLAEQAEADGDVQTALLAWRALRSGLLGVRHVMQPYPEKVALAEAHIAPLMARQEDPAADADRLAALEAEHLALLQQDLAPDTAWSVVAVLAFGVWVFGLMALATRGFDDATGALLPQPAARWAGLCAVAMALWMAGLARA